MTERTFDRLVQFDERSRAFPVRELLEQTDRTQPRSYSWSCSISLDQGREGACVGYAWAHEVAARPIVREADSDLALGFYRRAQFLDPWPGESYSGTSVLAGAKAAQEQGYLDEYRWAFSFTDALAAISRHGPAVLGVWWHEGMFHPDSSGFIHRTGDKLGGHAILATGVSVRNRTVRLHNSWGPGWGKGGDCLISWDDLEALLADDGEVCVPVVRGRV